MTENGIKSCISLLKLNYSYWMKDSSINEFKSLFKLWKLQFENINDDIVTKALGNLISSCKYVPTIAEIKEEIYKENIANRTDNEIRNIIEKALSNSLWHSNEEWEKLPSDIKMMVTSEELKNITLSRNINESINEIIKRYHNQIPYCYNELLKLENKIKQIN